MKNIFYVLLLIFFACGEEATEEVNCTDSILGIWNVTDISPVGCTLLTYEIGLGPEDNILSLNLDDGSQVLTGSGLIDDDCGSMTYTVSQGRTIVSGAIDFDGNTLVDKSGLGCLISAERR